MRIVLDTNIIISGLFWGGVPGKILDDGLKNKKYVFCFSNETFDELRDVLLFPKFQSQIQKLNFTVEDFLIELSELSLIFLTSPQENIIKNHPDDDKFITCAVASSAQYLISGDQHLLKLKEFQNIPILTPRQFLNRISKK